MQYTRNIAVIEALLKRFVPQEAKEEIFLTLEDHTGAVDYHILSYQDGSFIALKDPLGEKETLCIEKRDLLSLQGHSFFYRIYGKHKPEIKSYAVHLLFLKRS